MPRPTSSHRIRLGLLVAGTAAVAVAALLLALESSGVKRARGSAPGSASPAAATGPQLVGSKGAPPPEHDALEEDAALEEETEAPHPASDASRDSVRWTKTVSVVVRADDDGTPVAGATVRVLVSWHPEWFREAVTDVEGRAVLEGPDRGTVVWVRASGFVVSAYEVKDRAAMATGPLEMRLLRGAPLAGRVVRATDGLPVPGAEVYVYDADTWKEIEGAPERWGFLRDGGFVTDAQGTFAVAGVLPSTAVTIAARAEGLGLTVSRLEPGALPREVVLTLGAGASLSGLAMLDKKQPAAGVRVYAVTAGNEHHLRFPDGRWLAGSETRLSAYASTDATGRYRIEGLPVPGRYVAVAVGEADAQGASAPATLEEPGDHAVRDLEVRTPAWLSVRGFAGDGSPVAMEDCDLATLEGLPLNDPFFSGSEGYILGSNEYSLHTRPPGRWLLLVRPAGGWSPARVPVELQPGERKTVDVIFEPGAALEGAIHDTQGRPVVHAQVGCGEGTSYRSARSDAEGRFRLDGLSAGEVLLTVRDDLGYLQPATVQTPTSPPVPLRIVLQPRPEVVGRLELAPELGPRPSWDGRIRTSEEERIVWPQMQEDGSFRVPHVPIGTAFDLILVNSGASVPWIRRGLRVEVGGRLDLGVVRIAPGREVKGTVVDERGAPLARVQVVPDETVRAQDCHTDAAGRFTLLDAPAGAFTVVARAQGRPAVRIAIGIEPPPPIRCPRGTWVRGRLSGPAEDELAYRRLRFVPRAEPSHASAPVSHDATTSSVGAFELLVPVGTYDVHTVVKADELPSDRRRRTLDKLGVHVGQVEVTGPADRHALLRLP